MIGVSMVSWCARAFLLFWPNPYACAITIHDHLSVYNCANRTLCCYMLL